MGNSKQRVAAISIAASASMATLKFIVGVAIGSLALISDALHSLVDLGATIVTWIVVQFSDKPADDEHHYGHGKIESLSALGMIALLYILAGGIVVEAISRLRVGTAPTAISAIPFLVLLLDMVVNFWRARALQKTARETGSHALAADALHFSSDVYGSVAAMIGLGLSAWGYGWGDAAGAIGIAMLISILGLRLGRATIETLMDRAPEGATEKARRAISSISGIIHVERLRVRLVGATHFVDATVQVPRTLAIDRIEDIKRQAQTSLHEVLPDSDLTLAAVPVARDNESVRDRIMVIARNSNLAIHHVTIHDLGDRLTVGIDLEVDGDMPLEQAHAITQALEAAIRTDFGTDVEVDTHIEPLEPELPQGSDAGPARTEIIHAALAEFAASEGALHDIHNVRVRDSAAGEFVNFHCRADPAMTVIDVHEHVDQLERRLRRAFPGIRRVISHAEPARTSRST